MKGLSSPDSHWHDLGEVKYELLFPRRLLLQFLQHDDFPKALSKLECVTYLPFPEQRGSKAGWQHLWRSQTEMEMAGVPQQRGFSGSSHHHWCNRVGQHSWKEKERPMVIFECKDSSWLQDCCSCMLSLGGYSDWEGSRTGGGQQCTLLEGNLSRKAAQWPHGWFQFPNCQCIYKKSSAHWKLLVENFPFNPPSSHSLQL